MTQAFDRQLKLIGSLESAQLNAAKVALTRDGWSDTLLRLTLVWE